MRLLRTESLGLLLLAVSLAACTGGSATIGLVIIPPEVEQATAPEGKYQDVHAIYLYDIGYIHFDPIEVGNSEYPSFVSTRQAKIKLLTRAATEGGKYGNLRINHVGELLGVSARVIKPDGKVTELQKSDIVTNILVKDIVPGAIPAINLYETQVIFPGLEPGDIISYSYTQRGRNLTWAFNHLDAPVLYSKFMVARPLRRIEIQPLIYDRHKLEPAHSEDKGMATGMFGRVGSRQAEFDIWEARDVPPVRSEASMPNLVDLASRMRVWQGDRRWDWNTLGTTYYKWFTHYGRAPAKAKELAEKAIAGIEDPAGRARAIHDWVKANLNIQDYPELSWAPREFEIETIDLDKVLKEKNATPEQTASLMWEMMQAAGVEASVVLATRDEDPLAEEGLPDLYQFTTPLLALADGTFIDTTNRFCPFGLLPAAFEGRKSLWLRGQTVAFKDLPVSEARVNASSLSIKGELTPEGEAKVMVTQTLTGLSALSYRQTLGRMTPKEREDTMRYHVTGAAEKAELGEFVFNGLDDPAKPLELVYEFKVPGHAQVLRDRMIVKLAPFVNLTDCPDLVAEKRQNPVAFSFKSLEQMDITIALPIGYSLKDALKGFRTKEIETGTAVGVQTAYSSPDGKTLQVVRKLSRNERLIDLAAYPAMRRLFQAYLAAKDTLITLELPKMD